MRSLTVLFLCVGVANAQSEEDALGLVTSLLRSGSVQQIRPMLDGGFIEYLKGEPEAARRVCEAAAVGVLKTGRGNSDIWVDVAESFVELGEALAQAQEENADAVTAYAEALLCRARLKCATTGYDQECADWSKAADLYVKLDRLRPEEGKALARAVKILREGAAVAGAPCAKLNDRAAEICIKGAKSYPKNQYFRSVAHRAIFDSIERALPKDRKGAREQLERYLHELEAEIILAGKDSFALTAYNDAVSLARSQKRLGLKPKYRMRTVALSGRVLEVSFPLGTRWKWKPGRLGTLYQNDEEGKRIRSIRFTSYSWRKNYYIDMKQFGGDNIKGLARLGEYDVEQVLVKVTKRKALRRRRLNRYISTSQALTIGGIDEDGDFLCWHLYYFKGKKTKQSTFKISILERGDFKSLDPATEAVIASIREPGK
jgi:hypothetical protein